MLIHRGLKLEVRKNRPHLCLRVVLIHRGLKLDAVESEPFKCLRVVLIHREQKKIAHLFATIVSWSLVLSWEE